MPKVERNFPKSIAYGWYFVGYGDELAVGEVRPLHYFGRDLVLFRNESGEAAMLDAYCPHLGAHLGHGGHVKGDSITCPFHGWSFKKDGWCSGIPYATNMPPITQRQAVIHAYPVSEANGVIWAWYHPQNIAPMFEVAVYSEFTDPDWVKKQIRYEWKCAITPQEVAENGIDTAHFPFVHGTKAGGEVPDGSSSYEGHMRWTQSGGGPEKETTFPNGKVVKGAGVRTIQNGAGQKVTILKGLKEIALMVLVTPIEADDSELRFCFSHKNPVDAQEAEEYVAACAGTAGPTGVLADLPIWNNKIHRRHPILCDGDGQILRFRQYFKQFYVSDSGEPEQLYDGEPESIAAE